MQSVERPSAGGEIGGVIFGTPNGREVVAQTGISVPHNEDWVAEAAHALQFDLSTDTLVMQRFEHAGARVFWFGVFRRASEIDFNRGGYVGFGVWAVNCCIDGESLVRALSLAAEKLRDLAVRDGKFHTSIRTISDQFNGDPESYQAMLASARPLIGNASIAEGGQQPSVLDMRGCSDAWCAQIVDSYQSELGLRAGKALALARSDAVVESAARLRLWAVVSPIAWLSAHARTEAEELRGQLQSAQTQFSQQEDKLNELRNQVAIADQNSQGFASIKDRLMLAQKQAEHHKQEAQSAKSALEDLERRTQDEFTELARRVTYFESVAAERSKKLKDIEDRERSWANRPTQNDRQLSALALQRHLAEKRRLEEEIFSLRQENSELKNRVEDRTEDEVLDEQPTTVPGRRAGRSGNLLKAATLLGWLCAIVLFFAWTGRGDDRASIEKLQQEIEELAQSTNQLKREIRAARSAESRAIAELEDMRAQSRAAGAPKPQGSEGATRNSGAKTLQGQRGQARPSADSSKQSVTTKDQVEQSSVAQPTQENK